MSVNVIDCTFRDGGYYNNWSFSKDLANKYMQSIADSGIEFVEIGYRRINYDGFLGPFAFSKDSFLRGLKIPKKIKLGLMVNLDDIKPIKNIQNLIVQHFDFASKSPVKFIRIATKFEDINIALNLSKILKKLGYLTFINLMQAYELKENEFILISKKINKLNKPTVFYFADTYGNLDEVKIIELISLMNKHLKIEIGFHGHNNMSKALSNSLVAIKNKAKWIDSTLLGMGRGAGNLQTEYLLLNLRQNTECKYNPEAIFPIILDEFELLKKKYRWGENILYYLSAEFNIHPTYIQELLSHEYYKSYQILDALKFLKNAKIRNYSKLSLDKAIFSYPENAKGLCDPRMLINKKSILILANGSSLNIYKDEILRLIKTGSLFVLSLNISKHINETFIDAFIACHPSKILLDLNKYKKIKKPIIIPKMAIPKEISVKLKKNKIIDYGISIKNKIRIEKSSCTLPIPLAIGYALSFCYSGLAKEVFLAGFDGYEMDDPRQIQVNNTLKFFLNFSHKIPIKLITPSTYDAPKNSIYSMLPN
jgi:4-hydroxy 2-oxovalerate aldolase